MNGEEFDREVCIGPLPADDVDELVDHLTDHGIKRDAISVSVLEEVSDGAN